MLKLSYTLQSNLYLETAQGKDEKWFFNCGGLLIEIWFLKSRNTNSFLCGCILHFDFMHSIHKFI